MGSKEDGGCHVRTQFLSSVMYIYANSIRERSLNQSSEDVQFMLNSTVLNQLQSCLNIFYLCVLKQRDMANMYRRVRKDNYKLELETQGMSEPNMNYDN